MGRGQGLRRIGPGSVLIAIVVGAAAIVAYRLPPGGSGADLNLAVSATLSPTSGPTPAPATTLPPDTQEQLSKQAPETVIVACTVDQPVLPDGTRYSVNGAWAALHPGFRFLKHGYCADNPSATPLPNAVFEIPVTP